MAFFVYTCNIIDIFILSQLAEKVHLSSHVKPISLATYNTTNGERAVISGWGRTRLLSWLSQYLQKLSVSIIDNKACQKYYKDITILSSQICTLERKNIGACKVNVKKLFLLKLLNFVLKVGFLWIQET